MVEIKKLAIEITERGGYPIVAVSGEIDLYTAPQFRDALAAVRDDAPALIVDLSRISYIDSAGLSALLLTYRRLSGRGAVLCAVARPDNPGVSGVIEVTRLNSLIPIHATVEDALKELSMAVAL